MTYKGYNGNREFVEEYFSVGSFMYFYLSLNSTCCYCYCYCYCF